MIEPGPSICGILPGAAALLGVPGAEDPLGLRARFGARRQVVVVLIDGLGLHLMPHLAPHAPLLAAVLAGSAGRLDPLRSTFPSTTPTNLVSLTTGVPPGQHGVLGFTVTVPGTARVLTHVLWRDDPAPGLWQPVPTWFERLGAADVSSAVVLPAAFEGSGLTRAAYRGSSFVPLPDRRTHDAATILEVLAAGTRLVLGYTEVLDAAAHRFGIASPQWAAAGREVDAFLTAIVDGLPRDAVLLVTADHGGLDVPPETRTDMDANADLCEGVEVVAGEPRVRYLHVRCGAVDDVVAAWRAVLGERAGVHTRDELIDQGWFGPMRPEHAARVGDVVVVCGGTTVVLAGRHEPPQVAELIGFHGSDTDAETAVPLVQYAAGG